MKKLALLASSLVMLFSCTSKMQEPGSVNDVIVNPSDGQTEFFVEIEDTKTVLGPKDGTTYPNYWAAGDAISVNGINSAALDASSPYVGTNQAMFTINGIVSAPYRFAYPASAVSNYSNGTATITLPATQAWSASSYDSQAFVMVGSSNAINFSMTPMMAVIKLSITGDYASKITSVEFTSLGSEKVSGTFTTDFATLTATAAASPFLTVNAPEGGADIGTSVFLLIPAQNYGSGMDILINALDGTAMNVSTTDAFTALSSKVYTLEFTYAPSADIPFRIKDVTTLQQFASRVAGEGGEKNLNAVVVADIDASSLSWTSLDGYTGTLDGKNKTISGLTQPFFDNLEGSVKNLTLNSSINLTADPESEGVGIFANALINSGSISGCTSKGSIIFQPATQVYNGTRYVGGVVSRAENTATLTNCSNEATISVPDNSQNNEMILNIGGVVGTLNSSKSSSYLSNSGTIFVGVINSVETTLGVRFGGVAGYVTSSAAAISHCTNTGNINYSGACHGHLLIGGVGGYVRKAISYCENTADITSSGSMNNTGNYWYTVGGVIGWMDTSTNISNCNNNSGKTISVSGTTAKNLYVGGIVAYYKSKNTISNSTNAGSLEVTSGASINSILYLAGVAGKVESAGVVNSCSNSGSVFNAAATGSDDIDIAGVVANSNGNITSSFNTGTITNTGASGYDLCQAGVVGNTSGGKTMTSCYNTGNVVNLGAGGVLAIGGICGWSTNGTYAQCYNTGAISNSGLSNHTVDDSAGVRIAGLVGNAKNNSTLTGTSSVYNYNNGPVSENSSSIRVAVGGVCAFVDSDGKAEYTVNLDYCRNLSSGTVTASGSDKNSAYVGGVLGMTDYAVSIRSCTNNGNVNLTNLGVANLRVGGVMGGCGDCIPDISGVDSDNQTINSGNIKFTTCSVTGQVAAGGIFGTMESAAEYTIQHCTNSGTIMTNTQSTSSEDICTANMGAYNYIAGIGTCTSSNGAGKTFTNCHNNGGHIKVYVASRTRVGGITAICTIPPGNCDVTADLTLGWTTARAVDNVNAVGGIAAVQYDDSNTTSSFSNLYFNGVIDATNITHNNKRQLISGLVAARPNKAGTASEWTNCKVGGQIKSYSNSGYDKAGLFTSTQQTNANRPTISCTDCQILNGTKLIRGGDTYTVSADNPSPNYMVGGSGTTTSSMSGVSCVDSINP